MNEEYSITTINTDGSTKETCYFDTGEELVIYTSPIDLQIYEVCDIVITETDLPELTYDEITNDIHQTEFSIIQSTFRNIRESLQKDSELVHINSIKLKDLLLQLTFLLTQKNLSPLLERKIQQLIIELQSLSNKVNTSKQRTTLKIDESELPQTTDNDSELDLTLPPIQENLENTRKDEQLKVEAYLRSKNFIDDIYNKKVLLASSRKYLEKHHRQKYLTAKQSSCTYASTLNIFQFLSLEKHFNLTEDQLIQTIADLKRETFLPDGFTSNTNVITLAQSYGFSANYIMDLPGMVEVLNNDGAIVFGLGHAVAITGYEIKSGKLTFIINDPLRNNIQKKNAEDLLKSFMSSPSHNSSNISNAIGIQTLINL